MILIDSNYTLALVPSNTSSLIMSLSAVDEAMASVALFQLSSPIPTTPSPRSNTTAYTLPSIGTASTRSPEDSSPSPLAKYSSRLRREGAFYYGKTYQIAGTDLSTPRSSVDTEPDNEADQDAGMNDPDSVDSASDNDHDPFSTLYRSALASDDNMSTDAEPSIETGIEIKPGSNLDRSVVNLARRLSVAALLNPDDNTKVKQPGGFPILNQPDVWSIGESFKKAFVNLVPGLNIPLPSAFDPEMFRTHLRLELGVRGKTKFSGITIEDFLRLCVQCNQCLRYFSRRTSEFHVFPGPCLGEEGFFNPDFETELQLSGIDIADPEPRWAPTYICDGLYKRFHGVRVFEGITQEEFDFLWVKCFLCDRIMTRDAAFTHLCDARELDVGFLYMEDDD